jgi:hypothetical protein
MTDDGLSEITNALSASRRFIKDIWTLTCHRSG